MECRANPDPLSSVGALADPVRRRLYERVAEAEGPVTREEAAGRTGVSRALAAYHLDRLVEAGLLAVDYARPEGRDGPGAGRPAKRYARVADEVAVSFPPRDYGLLAGLLVDAVAQDETGTMTAALVEAATREGRAAAGEDADTLDTLARRGYEPEIAEDGDVTMRNCPFHRLADRRPGLVCALNHALLRGYLEGHGDDPDRAELDPCPGRCCVRIHAADSGAAC